MKRIKVIPTLILLAALLLVSGCSSDLEIMENHPAVPVIYAVINAYDSVHYVRVEKTFLIHQKEDWATLNPDSLQFHKVEVYLYGKAGQAVKWIEPFVETTVSKEEGFFPTGNYQVFKLNHRLPIHLSNPGRDYRGAPDIDSLILEVRIPELNLVTRAATFCLLPANIINYKSRYMIYVYGSYPTVFALSATGDTGPMVQSTMYQQIDFKVHFKEYYKNSFAVKEISWLANTGWDENAYFIRPTRLFNPMKELLSKSDSIMSRTLDSIDIALLRTSNFYNNYLYVREHWDDSDRPPYTNFDRSYGMFFQIARDEWTGMKLNWEAMDSLCNGYYYQEMKFRSY